MAELNLWLDYYDDIYSDFDSRNYIKRRVSEDFLFELKNAFKYKTGVVNDLIFLLPSNKREQNHENGINKSLKNFFFKQYQALNKQCRNKLNLGLLFGLIGILLMIVNSMISYKGINSLTLAVLRVVMEPAGWFLLWASFDLLFYDWKELKKEKQFFRNLSEINIGFRSY